MDSSIKKGSDAGSYPLHMDMHIVQARHSYTTKKQLHQTIAQNYPCTLLKHIDRKTFSTIIRAMPNQQKKELLLKVMSYEDLKKVAAQDLENIMNSNMTPEQVYEVLSRSLPPERLQELYSN